MGIKFFKVYSRPELVNKDLYKVMYKEYSYAEGKCKLSFSGFEGFTRSRLCSDTKVLSLCSKDSFMLRVSLNAPPRLAVSTIYGDSLVRYEEIKLPKNCSDVNKVTEFLLL